MIQVKCPSCGKTMFFNKSPEGEAITCKSCSLEFHLSGERSETGGDRATNGEAAPMAVGSDGWKWGQSDVGVRDRVAERHKHRVPDDSDPQVQEKRRKDRSLAAILFLIWLGIGTLFAVAVAAKEMRVQGIPFCFAASLAMMSLSGVLVCMAVVTVRICQKDGLIAALLVGPLLAGLFRSDELGTRRVMKWFWRFVLGIVLSLVAFGLSATLLEYPHR